MGRNRDKAVKHKRAIRAVKKQRRREHRKRVSLAARQSSAFSRAAVVMKWKDTESALMDATARMEQESRASNETMDKASQTIQRLTDEVLGLRKQRLQFAAMSGVLVVMLILSRFL